MLMCTCHRIRAEHNIHSDEKNIILITSHSSMFIYFVCAPIIITTTECERASVWSKIRAGELKIVELYEHENPRIVAIMPTSNPSCHSSDLRNLKLKIQLNNEIPLSFWTANSCGRSAKMYIIRGYRRYHRHDRLCGASGSHQQHNSVTEHLDIHVVHAARHLVVHWYNRWHHGGGWYRRTKS